MQISGSYSWALPQNVIALLASAPDVRAVWLESPGGNLQPAMQIAALIQERRLDTFVGRLCASACTIAFMGGVHRSLAPDARLGFHQARAPGFPDADANAVLKAAYDKVGLPASFVSRALRTPHSDMWYPSQEELRALKIVNAQPSPALLSLAAPPPPRLTDLVRLLPRTPDEAVPQFASELADLLSRLQAANPEACWAFAHEAPDDPGLVLTEPMLQAVAAARGRLVQAATAAQMPTPDPDLRQRAMKDLLDRVKAAGQFDELSGLRRDAARAAFCPSLRELLQAALALPPQQRPLTVRAVLAGL
ncbi:MAG: hypothetical protein U1E70_25575 [Acetobacteraceae bacterium]